MKPTVNKWSEANSALKAFLDASDFSGEIHWNDTHRVAYATDASPYRETPMAVAYPRHKGDVKTLIRAVSGKGISLIPRGAGTSLAGQVVGGGIVVDLSRHMNKVLQVDLERKQAKVEPGVVLEQLNQSLLPHRLFFAPETSTANRCTLGGMAGNNSCGSHSLVYGSTRDHVLSMEALLSDGTEVCFENLDRQQLGSKLRLPGREGEIYRCIAGILSEPANRQLILDRYPDPEIRRRNHGYALDELMQSEIFGGSGPFNFCRLLVGSEGTLVFITSLTLHLEPLPPPHKALLCVHLNTVEEALEANLIALKHSPCAIELMDEVILGCTKNNLEQQRNRFFVKGNPGALLMVEFAESSQEILRQKYTSLEQSLRDVGLGWHFPVLSGKDIGKAWALRKSGLGVLSNMPGDAKPVSVIEDTAVHPRDLSAYIREFRQILDRYGLYCVYHAHIATGELHLRPVLNLKNSRDVELFRAIAHETALLVKKYRGSLSGEHGDGRLRGEFIPLMLGEDIYEFLKQIKHTFDPEGIFNRGKIIDTPPMHTSLRYISDHKEPNYKTRFDFSREGGILRAAEQCNGSGDCLKLQTMGGVLCPSYMATREEPYSTRARANLLRECLSEYTGRDPFCNPALFDVLDTCLACKGCKSECPSNVDMAKLKAEFLFQWFRKHRTPFRSFLVTYIDPIQRLGLLLPALFNQIVNWKPVKRLSGFALERNIPGIAPFTLRKWASRHLEQINPPKDQALQCIWFFADEFTNRQDTETGIIALRLLCKLGYHVSIPKHRESGRAALSKGLLHRAGKLALANVHLLSRKVSVEHPLVGLEPSCLLTFRDEYPNLVPSEWKETAIRLGKCTWTLEEFLAAEADANRIRPEQFTDTPADLIFHGHCHQKALVSTGPLQRILSLPSGYKVREIPSGCCGMAGSFGYEKEHYELSMKIGELVLFPEVRKASSEVILSAPGTSCRQHILHGTGKKALHPAEVLWNALRD